MIANLGSIVYYKKRKSTLKPFKTLPKEHWKNNCPIVLVHGFAGQTTDKNFMFRGYFHYSFDSDVLGDNEEVYEADVNPFGSLHDRACELYQ